MIRKVLAVSAVLLAITASASATPLRWTLSEVTIGTGSQLTRVIGSFTYDADTDTWSELSITTSGGTLLPATSAWEFNVPHEANVPGASGFSAVYATSADWTGAFVLGLYNVSGQVLTDAGGAESLDYFRGGVCANSTCDAIDYDQPSSQVGTGSFVSAVPEPTSLLLLGTGVAGLAALRRRRR